MRMSFLKKIFPFFLVGYHLVFACFAWWYIVQNNGDAMKYWFVGQDLSQMAWADFFRPGTDIIKLITFPFVKYLHLPFLAGFILFSSWSAYGFYRLWEMMISRAKDNDLLILLSAMLLLLPNLHFWTSVIGKEAFLFVPVVLITENILKKRWYSLSMIFSFVVLGLVRPHVAAVFLLALVMAVMLREKLSMRSRMMLLFCAAVFGIAVYFILREITHSEHGLFNKIGRLYHAHNWKLKATSAYVPLEEYPYPYKMFTFYFRPLPFEKGAWYYHILGWESVAIMVLIVLLLYAILKNKVDIKWDIFKFFVVFVLLLYGTMYVYAYANFGLIVRTRALIIPVLYVGMLSFYRDFFEQKSVTENRNHKGNLDD